MWQKLRKDYQVYTKYRQIIIRESSQALHMAKQAVFILHRDQISQAEKLLSQIEKILIKLSVYFKKAPDLKFSGVYKAALEEYLEAKLFYQVLKFGKIKQVAKVKVNFDDYLGAICDLTGELVRRIILLVTAKRNKEAQKLKKLVAQIVGELIKIDLTGYLRHKYDDAKRNLKKAEEILYDVEIRRK